MRSFFGRNNSMAIHVLEMEPRASGKSVWLKRSAIFAVGVLLAGAYLNYRVTYSGGPVAVLSAAVLWLSTFLPLLLLPWKAGWTVQDIGFSLGWKSVIVSALLLALLVWFIPIRHLHWSEAATEAFARTGEELFFRGFLFTLLWRLARKKQHPWLWAVAGSSLAFALVHTQTFHAGGIIDQGVFPVIFRFFNLFLAGTLLSFIRWGTDSILPGAIFHATANEGLETIPYVLILYAVGWIWVRRCTAGRAGEAVERSLISS